MASNAPPNVKRPPPPPPSMSSVDAKKPPPKAPPKQAVSQMPADITDNKSAINRIMQAEKKTKSLDQDVNAFAENASPSRPQPKDLQEQSKADAAETTKSAKKPPPPPKFNQLGAKDSVQRLAPPQVGPMTGNSNLDASKQSASIMTRRPPPPNPPTDGTVKVVKRSLAVPPPPESEVAAETTSTIQTDNLENPPSGDPKSFVDMNATRGRIASARRQKFEEASQEKGTEQASRNVESERKGIEQMTEQSAVASELDSYTVMELQQQFAQADASIDVYKAVDQLNRAAAEEIDASEEIIPYETDDRMGKSDEDENLMEEVFKGGRLYVKCNSATDIRPPRLENGEIDKSLNFFMKFILGSGQQAMTKQTAIHYNCTLKPDFGNEIIAFNISNPLKLVSNRDISLLIELWNKGTFDDSLVATVTISTSMFFANPSQSNTMDVPIYTPSAIDRSIAGKLSFQFEFHEAKVGLIAVTVFSANDLRDTEAGGQHDSYCKLRLAGSYEKRGKTLKDCGSNPDWGEEEIVAWIDGVNWVEDLIIEVLDEDVGRDEVIGATTIPILEYMTDVHKQGSSQERFDLQYLQEKDWKSAGTLAARVEFLPSGCLTINCVRGRNLRNTNALGLQDTVLSFTLVGIASRVTKKTLPHKGGGPNPEWNAKLVFDIVDQYQVLIEAWDQDIANRDELIGYMELSLLSVFQKGHVRTWSSLKSKNDYGVIIDAGEVELQIEFQGPPGIAFPQHRTNVQTFDDTERTVLKSLDLVVEEHKLDETRGESAFEEKQEQAEAVAGDFTNEQIAAAFAYFDLDHNGFVGALELRHLLICMGELVTDEEIDMMICMVDTDGDGQVGLDEFRAIILHPDPSDPDFIREVQAKLEAQKHHEAQLGNLQQQKGQGSVGGVDLQVIHKQRAIQLRESKKQSLTKFCNENIVDFERIKKYHVQFLEIQQQDRVNGVVEFQQFCSVLRVEMIGEYRDMFALFDDKQVHFIDFRQFLLGLLNFVPVDKEVRLSFIFSVYDEMRHGYILRTDLEDILMGNHFQTREAITGKVSTVMKQARKADTDGLTLSEFIVVAKKFPNIMFIATESQSPTKQSAQKLKEGQALSEGMFG